MRQPVHTQSSTDAGSRPVGRGSNDLATAALVAGVLALLVALLPIPGNLAPGLAVVALALAAPAIWRLRQRRRGRGQVIAAVCLGGIVLGTTLVPGIVTSPRDQEGLPPQGAAPVVIQLGGAQYAGFSTVVDVTITNGGTEPLTGGMVMIHAVDTGDVVIEESFASMGRLAPGQTTTAAAYFIADLPADVRFVVVDPPRDATG